MTLFIVCFLADTLVHRLTENSVGKMLWWLSLKTLSLLKGNMTMLFLALVLYKVFFSRVLLNNAYCIGFGQVTIMKEFVWINIIFFHKFGFWASSQVKKIKSKTELFMWYMVIEILNSETHMTMFCILCNKWSYIYIQLGFIKVIISKTNIFPPHFQ
jgi:hypothetical protein